MFSSVSQSNLWSLNKTLTRTQYLGSVLVITLMACSSIEIVSVFSSVLFDNFPEVLKGPLLLLLLIPIVALYLVLLVHATWMRLKDIGDEEPHWVWAIAIVTPVVNVLVTLWLILIPGEERKNSDLEPLSGVVRKGA